MENGKLTTTLTMGSLQMSSHCTHLIKGFVFIQNYCDMSVVFLLLFCGSDVNKQFLSFPSPIHHQFHKKTKQKNPSTGKGCNPQRIRYSPGYRTASKLCLQLLLSLTSNPRHLGANGTHLNKSIN